MNTTFETIYRDLLNGEVGFYTYGNCGISPDPDLPLVMLSGSFNPLHRQHITMLEAAARYIKGPVWLEIAITNCEKDKGVISCDDLRDRIATIGDMCKDNTNIAGIILTNAPNFSDKVQLFRNNKIYFACGQDTLNRVVDRTYYTQSDSHILPYSDAMNILQQRAIFLVSPRTGVEVDRRCILVKYEKLEVELDEISSTQIREGEHD